MRVFASLLLFASSAFATVDVCPNAWPWVKVDGLSGKSFTYTPPPGYLVTQTCYKAGTIVKTSYVTKTCGQSVTVTSAYQYDLSHASFRLATCPQTPTATPTVPPPTMTPTPTPTATPTPPPVTPTPCIPLEECGARCGWVSDGCGGRLECGDCPPPPPPPGRFPDPNCENCVFPDVLTIHNWRDANTWHGEWFYFMAENTIRQIVIQAYDQKLYAVMVGGQEPKDAKKIFEFQGPGTVTIPYPLAGLPVQQWTHVYLAGGQGRMTIWIDEQNLVLIKSDENKAVTGGSR